MIPRYSRPEMTAIWSARNRYRIWFEIEALAAEKQGEIGQIPAEAARQIRAKGAPRVAAMTEADVARIEAIEREVRHDVIAFLTWLGEGIGEASRYLHQGLTSSDVLDTCLAVQLRDAAHLLAGGLDRLLAALKRRALEHRHTLTIGRSHGIHAEPTSFGLKLAGHWAEFARNRDRLAAATREIATCAVSGAVGTFAHTPPEVEAFVAERLGLAVEPVSTQVIPRDRHAMFFATLAVIASGIERLAVEIRHLQRSEVREAEEYFHPGQKGSSAMPHKRNPVLSENLTGLARLVRGYAIPALENVALWHERDISHSSVERVIAPDATIALDFALHRLAGMIETLVVYPDRMQANLDALGGVVHSGEVLLALTQAGLSREDAYRIVQRNAMATWMALGTEAAKSFRENLESDPEIAGRLDRAALDRAMDPRLHLAHVDAVLARVFGAPAGGDAPAADPARDDPPDRDRR
ncbi:adenylosuccinate lyase [Elioraea sp.]|uniref:adenylosuccinate lyase n=1 Tax=Elioraea sp. TaxID=2185103 RepID=UPI00307D0E62